MKPVPVYRWILLFVICCIASLDELRGDDLASRFDALVLQLDDPRFHQRVSASEKLLRAGLERSGEINTEVEKALGRGTQSKSLELRAAAQRVLKEIAFRYQQQQLDLLVNLHVPAEDINLPGWQDFAETVGTDLVSRRFFKQLVLRHAEALHAGDPRNANAENIAKSFYDPWKLPSENDLDWALLLFMEIRRGDNREATCNWRLMTALSNSAMGPDPETHPAVFKRLIEAWLRQQSDPAALRDCLLVTMRYGCYSTALRLCKRVWTNPQASPATQVTALLVGNALGAIELRAEAVKRMSDYRTASVWQTLGSRPTRIRTQVADVARVILLAQSGLDPRSAGFQNLIADRWLIYRDSSLGFSDQKRREESWRMAEQLLAVGAGQQVGEKPDTKPSVLHAKPD